VVDTYRLRFVRYSWYVILRTICFFLLLITGSGPETLITALAKRRDVKSLTAVSNNAGLGDFGLAKLLNSGQLDKLIISYLGG
jgi:hypothetical protein